MTDGQPSYGSDNRVNSSEETQWLNFLENNGFDASYVVGFGSGFGNDTSEILPIAAKPDADGNYSDTFDNSDVVLTVDNDNLSAELQSLLGLTVGASGNVTDNDDEGVDGWGNPTLVSVEFGGTTYTFNSSQTEHTINTDAGDLLIRDDGSYEFTQADSITADQTATVSYTVQDADGSTDTSSLVLTTQSAEIFNGSIIQNINAEEVYQLGGLASSVKVDISGYRDGVENGEIVLKKDGITVENYDLDNVFDGSNQSINTFGSGDLFDEVVIRNTDEYLFDIDRVEAIVEPDSSPILNGILVDGIVEGAVYTTTSGVTGTTDAKGAFSYREGDSVTFMVGDVVIGSATPEDLAAGQVFLQDLADVERTDLNDEYVENMAVFLQSLDADGNAENGITITPEMHAQFAEANLDLRSASEAELKAAIETAGHTYVTEAEAMEHVREMLELHAGISEFDERVADNDLLTATLAKGTLEGLSYVASSGLQGEMVDGVFEYGDGDTIELFVGEQLVASFSADRVGDDGVISFDEAGFTVSHEELDALLSPQAELAGTNRLNEDADVVSLIGEDEEPLFTHDESSDQGESVEEASVASLENTDGAGEAASLIADELLNSSEDELFKDEGEEGGAQQAKVPADQAEAPAHVTNPHDDLNTSNNSIDQ
ncbi:hypothetical protein HLB35_08535 [Halomonas sp. TBZ9]|uniref:Uncharacterized protein n=1 Tax=Vreelandella azerica TaxID=2732867 RepID=A0A7Y3TXI7_9GAMM|nr:hypothetical protein [Halomonas azerica]NOG31803.1 hypothetical protein [Halomonas azerica]